MAAAPETSPGEPSPIANVSEASAEIAAVEYGPYPPDHSITCPSGMVILPAVFIVAAEPPKSTRPIVELNVT